MIVKVQEIAAEDSKGMPLRLPVSYCHAGAVAKPSMWNHSARYLARPYRHASVDSHPLAGTSHLKFYLEHVCLTYVDMLEQLITERITFFWGGCSLQDFADSSGPDGLAQG